MATLRVYLFGGFDLHSDGAPLPAIPTQKARSLFAYLITYRDQRHTRDLLAGLFWPDMPDARARRRLSQALWHIRRTLTPQLPTLPPDQGRHGAVQRQSTVLVGRGSVQSTSQRGNESTG